MVNFFHLPELGLLIYPLTAAFQGVITEDVVQLRKSIGAPGMAVLQFGSNILLSVRAFYISFRTFDMHRLML